MGLHSGLFRCLWPNKGIFFKLVPKCSILSRLGLELKTSNQKLEGLTPKFRLGKKREGNLESSRDVSVRFSERVTCYPTWIMLVCVFIFFFSFTINFSCRRYLILVLVHISLLFLNILLKCRFSL